jgi:hypothetical protein
MCVKCNALRTTATSVLTTSCCYCTVLTICLYRCFFLRYNKYQPHTRWSSIHIHYTHTHTHTAYSSFFILLHFHFLHILHKNISVSFLFPRPARSTILVPNTNMDGDMVAIEIVLGLIIESSFFVLFVVCCCLFFSPRPASSAFLDIAIRLYTLPITNEET